MRISFQLGFPFLGSSARFNLYTMVLLVPRVAYFLQGSHQLSITLAVPQNTKTGKTHSFSHFIQTSVPRRGDVNRGRSLAPVQPRRSGGGTTRRERRRFVRSRWPSRRSPPPRWLGGEARLRCSLQPVDVERTSQEELRRTPREES